MPAGQESYRGHGQTPAGLQELESGSLLPAGLQSPVYARARVKHSALAGQRATVKVTLLFQTALT